MCAGESIPGKDPTAALCQVLPSFCTRQTNEENSSPVIRTVVGEKRTKTEKEEQEKTQLAVNRSVGLNLRGQSKVMEHKTVCKPLQECATRPAVPFLRIRGFYDAMHDGPYPQGLVPSCTNSCQQTNADGLHRRTNAANQPCNGGIAPYNVITSPGRSLLHGVLDLHTVCGGGGMYS